MNVTLIDGTGTAARPGMTVLVDGDTITDVFATGERTLPDSAEVLDLSGRYVIPGLINTHLHLPMLGFSRDSVAKGLERMLYAGVTTIREMAGDARLSAGMVRSALVEAAPFPSIHYAVRMADPTFYEARAGNPTLKGYAPGTAPWAQAITPDTDIALAVARAVGTGASGIEIYVDLDTITVRRIVEESHRQGLKAWAHGTVFPGGPLESVRAGIDGLSHACMLFWGLQADVPRRRADAKPLRLRRGPIVRPAISEPDTRDAHAGRRYGRDRPQRVAQPWSAGGRLHAAWCSRFSRNGRRSSRRSVRVPTATCSSVHPPGSCSRSFAQSREVALRFPRGVAANGARSGPAIRP